jgi:kynurenine formamidase
MPLLPRFEGRLVDLTLPLGPGMRGVSCEVAATVANQGWNATNWTLYSHAGTHMDAPIHYEASPQSIDQIPLERCMGAAHVLDLAGTPPRALLGPEHLGDLEATWQPDDILLLRTDWYRRHGTPEYRDALPRVSADLARWCVRRQVKLLGVEPPAVADPHNREEITAVHRILLEAGVVIVEGLAYLDQLTRPRVVFAALPLRLANGDGAPCRAFAFEQAGGI